MATAAPVSIRAAAALELRRRRADNEPDPSFRGYVERNNPTLLQFEHVPRLIDVCQRIVSGDLMRVIVIEPPRYFKTELFSRLLTGYFLEQHPSMHVGLASYGAELAWSISEEARNYFEMDGGQVRRETSAKKRWRTMAGGEMWAAGVGGPLLGFGYHLGIVDDPTDPEKAHSPTYQRRFRDWWPSKFLSRQEPNARIVVVMQRLGSGDPIDFLFRRELGDGIEAAPEHWHVVALDEIKSRGPLAEYDGPMGLPQTCTLEPDPREPGEVLAPSRFNPEEVDGMQAASGSYVTAAQRQQRPQRPTGDFWREPWFEVYDELPSDAYDGGKDWDTAYTANESNSASAWVESYRGPKGGPGDRDRFPIYIHDCDWDWLEFPELVYWMGGKKPPTGAPSDIDPVSGPHHIEDKASGKSARQTLEREGVKAQTVRVDGDKFTRAVSVQPVVSGGRIHVRRAILPKLLHGERQGLLRVTAETLLAGGPDLDLNDAFVQAINRHSGPSLDPDAFTPIKK